MTDRVMIRWPEAAPERWRGVVVAIGNFDGVHAGHRALLTMARKVAGADGQVVALTFDPHPRTVVRAEVPHQALMTLAERVGALMAQGADAVAVLPFDAQVAEWLPEAFIDRILQDWLTARHVCVGENFRFGRKAAGAPDLLAAQTDFTTHVLPLVRDETGEVISSTRLRQSSELKPS